MRPSDVLDLPGWKIVLSSVAGPQHVGVGLPCQDASHAQPVGEGLLIAVVSDGAGSARFAQLGSDLSARTIVSCFAEWLCDASALPDDATAMIERAVAQARAAIEAHIASSTEPTQMRDYHATLVGCIADRQRGYFFHIGDGAACALPDVENDVGTPAWDKATVSQAANGEHANETFFLTTEDWRAHLRITPFSGSRTIVLMSDGVTPFAMSPGGIEPEPRFLGPVHAHLAVRDAAQGRAALASTLDDERAHKVSGDDKSLVWARLMGC